MALWNFLEYYEPVRLNATPWREVGYVFLGLSVYFCTKTFVLVGGGLSGGAADEFVSPPTRPTVALVLKALVASVGNIVHLVGFWTLVDEFAFGDVCYANADASPLPVADSFANLFFWATGGAFHLDCSNRNFLYVFGGLLGLLASGTLSGNACVSPVSTVPRSPLSEAMQARGLQASLRQTGFHFLPQVSTATLERVRASSRLGSSVASAALRRSMTAGRSAVRSVSGGGGHFVSGGLGASRSAAEPSPLHAAGSAEPLGHARSSSAQSDDAPTPFTASNLATHNAQQPK